ncbi:MAG: TatD family hydrolase [Chloroflexi bacterium]|nr:TatD family hydrolase [Chloroflexota bacterium]
MTLIDTHAHLDMPEFDRDRDEVVARAKAAGVGTIIIVGSDLASSQKAIALTERYSGTYATVGFHPHEVTNVTKAAVANLASLGRNPKVVAIGEIGLDFYRNRSPRDRQLEALQWQLELAQDLSLPVVIHCRQAEKDILALLRAWSESYKLPGQPRGIIHCFNGDTPIAEHYLEMGFFLSLGAYIGYPSSGMGPTIRSIPGDRLVVETDCPYLPPQPYRGKRNEPAYIPLVVGKLAEIRGTTPETVAHETAANARRLFRLAEESKKG